MYFRTRIFAISILTVSAVLTIVISLSWSRIMKVELDRLDDRLCMEAKRMIPKSLNTLPSNAQPSKALDTHVAAPKVATPKVATSAEPTSTIPRVNHSELSGQRLIDDLVGKLRTSAPSQLMVFAESNAHGLVAQTEGVDIPNIISTLSWVSVERNQSRGKNPVTPLCQLASFEHQQKQWRASYYDSPHTQSFIAVDIAAPTSELQNTLRSAFIVVIPFSLLLGILGAWFIASNAIRPIKRLHQSMDGVTQKDLSQRLPMHKEDKEFKVLIDAYNTMLNRLEESFQQASRFTADAAHELKTPLTVLRGKLEQAIIAENTEQLDLNAILDEVGHLSAITRKLLLLSQADSCSMALHLEAINISELLEELTDDIALLSEHLVLDCVIQPRLMLKGDIVLLTQLLNNLLVNVMRYSLQEQGVTIQAKQHESDIEVLISNACVPITNDVRIQLFDRFYRGDLAQVQGSAGSGLGLSLSREIARAHGGDLTLEPSAQDVVSMRLLLPIR